MEQPHQHGPQCKHGHGGHGHGHSHGGHGHQRSFDISPEQYFNKIKQMKQKNIEFYWMEILSGNYFNKYCQMKGIDIVRSLNCQVITMIVAQAQMMFTCQWLPLYIRPLVSGMFFPLVFMLLFNLNVIYGVSNPQLTLLHLFSYLSIILYILTAFRQAGILTTIQSLKKSQQAVRQRIYLQNPNANCNQCKILKVFRSFHCPVCKVCVSKFTRHSLAFGVCIGSSNELLAWSFFTSMAAAQLTTLIYFFQFTQYGIITNIMFYALNIYIFWSCFVESATLFILNFCYGITQHELRTWMMNQYLMKVPQRQFTNSISKGLLNNLLESLYALFNISGYQSNRKKPAYNPMQQEIPISGNKQFEKLDPNEVYLVNWSKAFFYLTPHIPSHPSREKVIQIMTRQEPKMLEMYQMQKKFKQQVIKQTQGQGLNDFQIQQRVAMKLQQHMMKNQTMQQGPQSMMQPNPAQQKMILTQMLSHMAGQLAQKQPQISQKIKTLLKSVQQDKTSPMQANLQMRKIQQQLMKIQMQSVMKARQQQQKLKNKMVQQKPQAEDEQTQLKKQQAELQDEDL